MIHGPFPIVRWQLFWGLPMLLLSGGMLLFTALPAVLCCDAAAQLCRFEHPMRRTREYPYSSVQEVQVVRDGRLSVAVLQLRDATRISLGQHVHGQARSFADRVNAALSGGESFEVPLPAPWHLILLFALLTANGVFLIYLALRSVGSYRIEPGAGALAVRQTFFGVPISRMTVSTDDVRRVELEYERDGDAMQPRDQRARLVLVTTDGTRRPLSARKHYGHELHLRAAAELRALLGL